MPEAAIIDAPAQEAGPSTSGPGFNTMVEQLERGMAEVKSTPTEQQPVIPDTRPVEQKPVEKIQKTEPAKPADKPKENEPFVSPAAANFKKIVAERDEWQKKATEHETAIKARDERLAALQKDHDEYKAKTTFNPEEYEKLKKDKEATDELLGRFYLENTPKFRDYYERKFQASLTKATEVVGKDKAAHIKFLMEQPKSEQRTQALEAIMTEMEKHVDRIALGNAFDAYDDIRNERSIELGNHKSALKELQAHEAKARKDQEERTAINQREHQKTMLKETMAKADTYESFKPNDDPEHNAQVAKNRKMVESLIDGSMDNGVTLMLPVLAAEGARLTKVAAAQQAKITELEEALAKYKTAQPALEGSGAPAGEKTAKSYTEQVMEGLLSIPK